MIWNGKDWELTNRDDVLDDQQYEILMDALIEENGTSSIELANSLWLINSHLKCIRY